MMVRMVLERFVLFAGPGHPPGSPQESAQISTWTDFLGITGARALRSELPESNPPIIATGQQPEAIHREGQVSYGSTVHGLAVL